MVENVQCPVCTLFLHAGMNLSDHLETHPKEQVIKALVQMTITGNGAALAASLASDMKPDVDTKPTAEKEPDLSSNPASNSSSSLGSASGVSSNGLNFANAFNSLPTPVTTTTTKKLQDAVVTMAPATGGPDTGSAGESRKGIYNAPASNVAQTYQRSAVTTATVGSFGESKAADFSAFSANRYQQQQSTSQQQHAGTSQLQQQQQQQQSQQQQQASTHQQHAIQTAVNQQRTALPPPPPLPPLPVVQQVGQLSNTLQQQQQHSLLAAPVTQRHHPMHPQQHQQQNLKILYSTALPPPPPPLQLFFQQPPQAQHQKPPPAYGTAISQIRSQHNLNKKPVTMTILQHQPQHQQQQQHVRGASSSHLYPPLHAQPQPSQSIVAVSNTKHMFTASKPAELPPPPPPPPPTSATAQQQKLAGEPHNHHSLYASNSSNVAPNQKAIMSTHRVTAAAPPPSLPHPGAVVAASQPQAAAVATSASASSSSSGNRQTNSPFPALLVAAAQSPSSVLRYAESPVAHYLERDNGDFIVQETPKHIVECVEKDNGEFSVIERIYQSPPSVLHIHDDDDDDDEDVSGNDCEPQEIGSDSGMEPPSTSGTNRAKARSEDEEEFLSIASESDQEEATAPSVANKRPKADVGGSPVSSNSNTNAGVSVGVTNVANAVAVPIAADSNSSSNSSSNVNSSSCSNSLCVPRKKSSKNTITVLSDVQLNLNEYLDLVGNIIASSKISPQRAPFSGSAPIPMLKVEKVEPPDEYEMAEQQEEQEDPHQHQHQSERQQLLQIEDEEEEEEKFGELAPDEPNEIEPPTIANKNETEELVENNCSSNKTSVNENDDSLMAEDCKEHKRAAHSGQNVAAAIAVASPTCPSHVTSVIRMATTSQQQHQQMQQQQQAHQQHQKQSLPDIEAQSIAMSIDHMESETTKLFDVEMAEGGEGVAEDLSQPQLKTEADQQQQCREIEEERSPAKGIAPPPPPPSHKKGPKKLIIKPKATKTDTIANINNNNNNSNSSSTSGNRTISNTTQSSKCNMLVLEARARSSVGSDQPTTSAMAQKELQEKERQKHQHHHHHHQKQQRDPQQCETLPHNVVIKSEPNSTAYDGCNSSSSILEQHLKSSASVCDVQQVECKQEHLSLQEQPTQAVPKDEKLRPLKVETTSENTAEDARVLLEFANSKKRGTGNALPANFLSSSSIFSNGSVTAAPAAVTTTTASSSSTVSDRPLSSTSLRCEDEFVAGDVVQEIVISSSYSSQSASDVALNANPSAVGASTSGPTAGQQQEQHQHTFNDYPFSFLYGVGANNAAGMQSETKGHFSPIYQQAQDATTAATLASGSNSAQIEDSTSTHGSQQQAGNHFGSNATHWYHHAVSTANSDFEAALAVDCSAAVDGDVGKYLDLDTCKRESLVGVQAAPSSTSSSFTAATESSLAGGCTTDALNIRTDEKMPAKGEISGQESNCDIENSWSQPMYGEISTRFFKTSFPGIFQQENGWNNDEYFTVQDLSASTTATPSANSSANKPTKSFDFRLPLEASTSATVLGSSNNNNLQQLFPQHSADVLPSTSANKKKRKRDVHGDKTTITRMQPTATITSQQLLFSHPNQQNQQQYPLLEHMQLQQVNPTTSASALLAGPSTAVAGAGAGAGAAAQPKPRKKVYQCTHCTAEFPKLKDRNSHMIVVHNYVRQNRRLICSQASQGTSTATITSADMVAMNMASPNGSAVLQTQSMEFIEDSKQGIVKIEIDNTEQPLQMTAGGESAHAKTEFIDEKDNLALEQTSNTDAVATAGELDTKPALQPLAVTTPATKLATLYRMLVSFNISTLKQSQNLSEFEEKLIETSIFFCYVCRRNFGSVKLYDAHLTEHPAECFTCGKKFQRWKNFSLHLKRHLGWKEFGCNVCDKKFVVRSALVEHMRMHTGHTPLKCKVCGKYFKRYSNLTQHRKRHGKQIIRKKEYVCHCGEVLPSKARFLWHKETHDAKPKCCPYCCDRFVHANSLRRHIRLAHSDKFDYTEPMECPMCKQIFAKSSIKAHMATHSMDTQHDCPICNKSFSTKWNLKIHSWVHANRTAKPFKCEHCPKAFVREVDFKNHMNAHKQIKPYTCEYCGCKFIRKYNYMRHRREHHGNKKFTCDLCRKSFHRHYYLIEHRRIHTGERPFQCTICGKSSTTKTNHNKHLKIHHSRDPFTVEA